MYTIAHRGLAEDYPENTLTAIRESSKLCDIVEVDVRQTSAGELVVLHDDTLERVSENSDKSVYIHSLDELQDDLADEDGLLPTLEEALSASHSPVLVELKGPMDISKVIEVIESTEQKVFVQSFHPSHFREVSQNWDGRAGLIVPKSGLLGDTGVPIDSITTPRNGIEFVSEHQGDFISLHHQFCSETIVESAVAAGLDVFGWTARSSDQYNQVVESDVDGVLVDSLRIVRN